MRQLFLIIICTIISQASNFCQKTIVLESGPISYTNIDDNHGTPVEDEYDLDLTDHNCSSIAFAVDFSFSLDWVTSGDRMESSAVCSGCAGDPTQPTAGSCDNCWDFMWIEFIIDGDVEEEKLIGVPGCIEQDGSVLSTEYCLTDEEEATIRITNSNWAADETNTFENVSILCWGEPEIETNSPICDGGILELNGESNDNGGIDDWEWSNDGGGNIIEDQEQNTTSENAEDGEEYTLTVTDENGCTASTSTVIELAGGYEAELCCGDIIICEGECADITNFITVELNGGDEPYTIELIIGGFLPITVPGADTDELTFQLCEGGPGFEIGDPTIIEIPGFIYDLGFIDIELVSVVDDSGCPADIIGGSISAEVKENPEGEDPDTEPFCLDDDTEIDLTQYDDDILDGGDGVVIWYTSDDEDDDISDPEEFDAEGVNSVFARVFDDPCFSDFIEVPIDIRIRPEITLIETEIVNCGYELELPDFDDIVDIENEDNPEYYLDTDLNEGPYEEGEIIDFEGFDKLYVYDASASFCSDIIEIDLIYLEPPVINEPEGPLTACGSIELPDIDIDNFDTYEYNTEEDGSGDSYEEGDQLDESLGITTIYLIAEIELNGTICFDVREIELNYLGGVSFSAEVLEQSCDNLILPIITPPSSTVIYNTEEDGSGDSFMPGDEITFDINNTGQSIIDTLYILDPNQTGACAEAVPVPFEILRTPILSIPIQTDFCERGFLPPPTADNPNLEYASTPTFEPSSILNPSVTILEDVDVYMRDSVSFSTGPGACYVFDSYELRIFEPPYTGQDSSITICQGYSRGFNLFDLLVDPDEDGIFTTNANIPDFDPNEDPLNSNLGLADVGTYEIFYTIDKEGCPPAASTITIEVIPPPNIPIFEAILSTCDEEEEFNLVEILDNPEEGGRWFAVGQFGLEIPISDPMAYSVSMTPNANQQDTFTIAYRFDDSFDNPFCEAYFALVKIALGDAPNAGDDQNSAVCLGQIIDLKTLLGSNAEAGGEFVSSDGSLIFFGDEWNTNILSPEPSYEIWYVLEPQGCPPDTAFLTVSLSDVLSAGIPAADLLVCEQQIINLSDYLEGESPGGTYYISNDLSTPIDEEWPVTTETEFAYIISGAAGCPPDTTLFTLSTVPALELQIAEPSQLSICEDDDCFRFNILSSFEGTLEITVVNFNIAEAVELDFELFEFQNAIYFCPSETVGVSSVSQDSVFIGSGSNIIVLFENASSSDNICSEIEINSEHILVVNENKEVTFNGIACPGEAVTINGEDYTTSQDLDLTTTVGCDSLVHIIVDFYPETPNDISQTLCEGSEFPIGGFNFVSDIDTTIILENGSFFGCDSTINLNLTFEQVASGTFESSICPGGMIEVDGVIFDENKLSEEVPFSGGSVFGCDSVTVVTIELLSENEGELMMEICPGDDFEFGGTTFNEDMLSAQVTLANEASNGCDSLVNVSLELYLLTVGELELDLCEDDELEFGGITYSATNTTGQSILPNQSINGCDSLVDVTANITIEEIEMIEESICEGETVDLFGQSYTVDEVPEEISFMDINGCDSITYLIEVEVIDGLLDLTAEPVCEGIQEGIIVFNNGNVTSPIEFYVNGSLVLEVDAANGDEPPFNLPGIVGMNEVQIIGANCEFTSNIEIQSLGENGLEISASNIADNTYELILISDATVANSIWTPSDILSCAEDCNMTTALITENTVVSVEAITSEGCVLTASINLDYIQVIPDTTIRIYDNNIISSSSNGDDVFFIQSNISTEIDELRIYDRWGNLVFRNQQFMSNLSNEGWNGTYNDTPVEQGVYLYMVEYNDAVRGTQSLIGQITVVK